MRLSVLQSDQGFSREAFAEDLKVFLDGVELKDAVTADTELGLVVVLERQPYGPPLHVEKRGHVLIMKGNVVAAVGKIPQTPEEEASAYITIENDDPTPSRMARIIAARRSRFKAKPFTTEHDEGVHRAISAMQKPGRANEL